MSSYSYNFNLKSAANTIPNSYVCMHSHLGILNIVLNILGIGSHRVAKLSQSLAGFNVQL